MNYNEIKNKLPKCWEDITLATYQKLSAIEVQDDLFDEIIFTQKIESDINTNIEIICLLTGAINDDINALTMVQLTDLISVLAFMDTEIEPSANKIKFKKYNELSYDDFISYTKYWENQSEVFNNLDTMLSIFSKDKLSNEYFLNLSIPEALQCFFILQQNTKKYLRSSTVSLLNQLVKIKLKELKKMLMLYCRNLFQSKKTLTANGVIG
ncbi:hypothetical protein BDD43_2830 [Mucilaginibacter gracilis]|uniref:Uncharacterized protein n=1 Tax=Mucilaginibacter gracilis TaxID=423350 RepID=A0A495J0Y1_9SPHI|nr:hypothetical protein [Mucilaginibacter gracilis]RKR82645.1 hypothetical protein BDD43_2830 [Mucilaginibacter gracilis]